MANKNFEVKHGLSVGGTERITSAGAGSLTDLTVPNGGRLLVGDTSAVATTGGTGTAQVLGTGNSDTVFTIGRFSDNTGVGAINFVKSRNGTIGSNTIVQDGDGLGSIVWAAADGSDFVSHAAKIDARIDGTPGANDTPGRLGFYTSADGTQSAVERMRIDSSGNVGIGVTPSAQLHVSYQASSITDPTGLLVSNTSSSQGNRHGIALQSPAGAGIDVGIGFYAGTDKKWSLMYDNAEAGLHIYDEVNDDKVLTARAGGNVGIGTNDPDTALHVRQTNASASYNYAARYVAVFERNGNSDVAILAANDSGSSISFSDPEDADVGRIYYDHANNSMDFYTNTSERMSINSTGSVGIAIAAETTYSGYLGLEFGQQGAIIANRSGDDYGLKVNTYLDSGGNWKRKETGVASSLDFDGDQIKFFTAASGSADANISFAQKLRIDNDGIKFGQDTAAANALDDYEEGNHTATITCASGSITLYSNYNNLSYTKVGRMVHIQGKLAVQAVSSPTGATTVSLPFAVSDLNDRGESGSHIGVGYFNGDSINTGFHNVYMEIAAGVSYVRPYLMKPSSTAGNAPGTHNLGDGYMATGSDIYLNFIYYT